MAEVKLEDAPQGVRTYYDKGIAALERSNFDYAMDMFEAVLKIEPRLLQVRSQPQSQQLRSKWGRWEKFGFDSFSALDLVFG